MEKYMVDAMVKAMMHLKSQEKSFHIIMDDIIQGKLTRESLVTLPIKDVAALIGYYELSSRVVAGFDTVDKEEMYAAMVMNMGPDQLLDVLAEMAKGHGGYHAG